MSFLSKSFTSKLLLPLFFALIALAQAVSPLVASAVDIAANKVSLQNYGFVLNTPYQLVAGQPTATGEFKNGNISQGQKYPEGSCVPVLVEVSHNNNTAGDINLSLIYDYSHASGSIGYNNLEQAVAGSGSNPSAISNLNQLSFTKQSISATTSFPKLTGSTLGAVSAQIVGPFSDITGTVAVTATDAQRHYNVKLLSVAKTDKVYITFCGRLDVNASQYPGASLSLRIDGQQGGAQNLPIQPNDLLVLPSLTINKVVSGGTATPDQWTFTVSPAINGVSTYTPDANGTIFIDNISPNGTYTVTENAGPASYTLTSVSGTNCAATTGMSASTTIAAGKPAVSGVCTFTNTFVPAPQAQLTVIKVVTNDNGGALQVADFPLFVDGNSVTSEVPVSLAPGTYTVSETNQTGYAATFSGACNAQGQVTLMDGDDKVCTITNNDIAPRLVISKIVNGGDRTPAAFTLNVAATNPSAETVTGSTSGVTVTLNPGSYSVTESDSLGYTPSYSIDCTGTIALGETKMCTVTNTFPETVTGTVTVVKVVQNDNGGLLQVSDVPLFINGTPVTSGSAQTLLFGDYTISETNPSGYVATFSGDCDSQTHMLTIDAITPDKTCTITNDDIAPKLTVTKVVNGGTLLATDFPLFANGNSISTGQQFEINAGVVTITETNQANYTASFGGDCNAQGQVTLAPGDVKACTITNTFSNENNGGGNGGGGPVTVVDPAITKTVDNGTPVEGSTIVYTITVTNSTAPVSGLVVADMLPATVTFVSSVASQGTYTNTTGLWAVGDLAPNATAMLMITATVNSGAAAASPVVNTASVNALDQVDTNTENNTATASFVATAPQGNGGGNGGGNENRPGQGTLIVIKNVVNDNGGSLTPADFTLQLFATNASQASIIGSATGVSVTLDAGTYALREADSKNYAATFSADCEGSIAANETKTCTVTNNDPSAAPVVAGGGGGGGGGSFFTPQGTSGGGSGSSAGSGTPSGQVLGTSTGTGSGTPQIADAAATSAAPVAPSVLGASVTALPRTGFGLEFLAPFFTFIFGILAIRSVRS